MEREGQQGDGLGWSNGDAFEFEKKHQLLSESCHRSVHDDFSLLRRGRVALWPQQPRGETKLFAAALTSGSLQVLAEGRRELRP